MANPNPSPATRFKPGSTPNPGGMSAEVRARNDRVADMASQLREKLLSSTMDKIAAGEDPLGLISADIIRVLKDSEDRAHGTPKQAVELAGKNGGPIQTLDVSALSDAALREIMAATRAHPESDPE